MEKVPSLSALFFWNQLTALSEGCLYFHLLSCQSGTLGFILYQSYNFGFCSVYSILSQTLSEYSIVFSAYCDEFSCSVTFEKGK
jgi:hypothetical protein